MIVGEMCVLSLIYSYVTVCRFCAVCCIIIICFFLLFSNYSTYFLIFSLCLFFFAFFFSILWLLCFLFCFCIVLCTVSPCVPSLSYFCVSLLTTATGWNPIAVNKYHIMTYTSCKPSEVCSCLSTRMRRATLSVVFVKQVYSDSSNSSGSCGVRPLLRNLTLALYSNKVQDEVLV